MQQNFAVYLINNYMTLRIIICFRVSFSLKFFSTLNFFFFHYKLIILIENFIYKTVVKTHVCSFITDQITKLKNFTQNFLIFFIYFKSTIKTNNSSNNGGWPWSKCLLKNETSYEFLKLFLVDKKFFCLR